MPWTAEPNLRTDKPERSTVALVQPGDGRDPDKDPFAQGPVLHLMSPASARTLAADLLRAADEVEPAAPAEPVGERLTDILPPSEAEQAVRVALAGGEFFAALLRNKEFAKRPTTRHIVALLDECERLRGALASERANVAGLEAELAAAREPVSKVLA